MSKGSLFSWFLFDFSLKIHRLFHLEKDIRKINLKSETELNPQDNPQIFHLFQTREQLRYVEELLIKFANVIGFNLEYIDDEIKRDGELTEYVRI